MGLISRVSSRTYRFKKSMALEYLYKNQLPEKLDAAVKQLGLEKPRDLYSGLIDNLSCHALHAEIVSEHVTPPSETEETIQNSTSTESPIEYPSIYSPLNYETVGSNYVLTVNHKNQDTEIPTFFTGEISDNVKNYGKAKVLWMSQSNPDCNEVPIACTLLTNTGIGTKIKCLDKIYLHSKTGVYGEAYSKISDAQFSATAKPKGSNSDAIKKWISGRNRLTGSLEICQFDKVDMVFDALSKNSASVFVGEDDFLVWESNCSFNADKGKYEPFTGGLKQPNEMVDFYTDLLKRYTFIRYLIQPFQPEHGEQLEALKQKLEDQAIKCTVLEKTDELGQAEKTSKILSITNENKIHCRQALKWWFHEEDLEKRYDVVLMDASCMLPKFLN